MTTPDPTEMPSGEPIGDEPARSTRRRWIIIAIAAALLLIAVLVAVAVANGRSSAPASSPSSSASASPSASASATPTPSPSPSSVPSPSATPTQSITTAPDGSEQIETGIDSTPTVAPGITTRIANIEAIQGTADEPGTVAGPAIRITVEFANSTDSAISLDSAILNVAYGSDQSPASELPQSNDRPVSGDLAAGSTVTGTYTYRVPQDQRDNVRIEVFTAPDLPVVVFSGAVPR